MADLARTAAKPRKQRMGPRPLFVMGGVIWGLVLGPDIGLAVSKFLGGLNWTFIAGTREWPDWADWVIIGTGVVTGFTIFFTALFTGRNIGDRFEFSHDMRLRYGPAIPWAVIAVGVAVGGITALTIDERKEAVVAFVQDQKDALVRLEAFANQVQRFKHVRVEWPGGGEEGRVTLSFRGQHNGSYLLDWEILAAGNKEPLMAGEIGASLRPGEQNTSLPLSPLALVNAWRKQAGNVAIATVAEDFTFRIRLTPQPTRAEWDRLPRHEPGNLADGKSILIDEAFDVFPVSFELRGSQIIW